MSRSDWSLEQYEIRRRRDELTFWAQKVGAFFLNAALLGLFMGIALGIAFSVGRWLESYSLDYQAALDRQTIARICRERIQAGLYVSDACRPLVDGPRGDLEK